MRLNMSHSGLRESEGLIEQFHNAAKESGVKAELLYHAVANGAEAVMVTNETAVGKYPVEVIRYLTKTAEEACKDV